MFLQIVADKEKFLLDLEKEVYDSSATLATSEDRNIKADILYDVANELENYIKQ